MTALAVVLFAAAAGGVAWWRVRSAGERPVRLTQVWAVPQDLHGEYDRVLAVWSTPQWLVRVTDMGFFAYNWSDGRTAWSVPEQYFDAASGKISAAGIGTVHVEETGPDGNTGFDALHGRDAPPGPGGGVRAVRDPNVPRPQTPRRRKGFTADHQRLVEVVAQDPDTGEDIGHFAVPAAELGDHREFVIRGPNGLIVTVPLTNNYGYPVAFRKS
ncbi:hypothetical protein [Streptomyces sp. NBC_01190]|uniref:hypothetical protein n=1 Tax=Streptomyces sp. NBC_01190 TaxID=2903767 RepID=UPI0038695FD9|nr:hypothetical protein OG519_30950 [Streptomyces sp. NBC_01190]